MFADPKKTAVRRVRRRLKASASIVVAVIAGAWLACKPSSGPGPSPSGPDARVGPDRTGGSAPPPNPEDASQPDPLDAQSDAGDSAIVEAGADGGTESGIARRRTAPRTPQVDRHEHRNGMPVRDNLLE
ncbi:MAG: hypothetical protein Q8Q09_25970 [Deltaproteobacteria bacterium]|nr:hypothetical protein [Deltaproteobacteria bacterium]